MKHLSLFFIFFVAYFTLQAQERNQINYFESIPPPADSAVIFAKGIISLKDRWEEKITFSPDGKECFFGRHPNGGEGYFRPKLMHARYKDGKWSEPDIMYFAKKRVIGYPILSLQGTILLMEQPIKPTPKGVTGRITFSKKENKHWSEIDSIIPEVNAKKGFGLAQITNDSVLYFHDRFHRIAYTSKISNKQYSIPKPLPYRINPCVEFFVSPKGDYIIFKPVNWTTQFHISYKNEENEWSMPIPFGKYFKENKVNGYGPYVSPDGNYFFFGKDGDIYWVKTEFIDALRKEAYY